MISNRLDSSVGPCYGDKPTYIYLCSLCYYVLSTQCAPGACAELFTSDLALGAMDMFHGRLLPSKLRNSASKSFNLLSLDGNMT